MIRWRIALFGCCPLEIWASGFERALAMQASFSDF